MVFSDTTLRQGLLQDMEDICGLGATGITGNATLLQQFTRWSNKWNKTGARIAIQATDGWDLDDPAYTTYPSGTYVGTTNRDYAIATSEKMLKIKSVGISYDGTNYRKAEAIDSRDMLNVAKDPNIDNYFSRQTPKYDPKANSIDIYPKFTAAEVSAGAKVYIEFLREPKDFATTGTDTQEPGFASPFHELISKGASYEYCSLYKPDLAARLHQDLFGQVMRNGNVVGGLVKEMEQWYATKYPKRTKIVGRYKQYD